MERDYQRYKLSKNIANAARKMFPKSQAIFAILSKFAYLQMDNRPLVGDAIYTHSFDLTHPPNAFLLEELVNRKMVLTAYYAIKFIHRINALIRDYYQLPLPPPAKVCMMIHAISYKQYYKKFKFNQYPTWINIGRNDILRMLLRYDSMSYNTQILCIPENTWSVLCKTFNVWLEGFASPIDTQIMKYGGFGKFFCSCFPDTDRPFGSIGSFFTARKNSGSIMAHPPPSMVNAASTHIIDCCIEAAKTSKNIRFFFFAEVDAIPVFDASEFTTYKYVMKPQTYYYESYSSSGQKYKIPGKTQLCIYVLEVVDDDTDIDQNYEKIALSMCTDVGLSSNFKIENPSNRYSVLIPNRK